eukprot:CAMPEP_0169409112 /NCGR_PEP_ID=MMETSP1017-20121227/59069_1 /TAXON_ID=342587 /ORGANISM="Karlodinium micrum, Strain CCMP2283" /LENGTH=40 /DNA_ID= /DNA_START= /DNA_END= /DNA_ORIENTATION=
MYSIICVCVGLAVTSARRVQTASGMGELTDAEIGLLNLKN